MSRHPEWAGKLAVLLTIVLLLTGCGAESADPPAVSRSPALVGEPQPGGELIVAVQDTAASLDPHVVTAAGAMRMIENMYSTLLAYGETAGSVEPDLADRYSLSDDQLTYTFHLRRDATFHSGRAVTADDVRFSIERIREAGVRASHFAAVEAIETPDAHTLVLRLREPMAPLLTYLAYPMNAVVDRGVIEAHADRLDHADAGSGLFKLVEWRPGQHLILERHTGYHRGGLPYLDRVVFRPIADDTARTTALRTGEVDLILDVTAERVDLLSDVEGVVLGAVPGTFWEYLGLNCDRPPFDDVRVRQAIACAIDRDVINHLVKFGRATVLDGSLIPSTHWAYADLHLYEERDLDQARALLAEAGYPDGFRTTMKVGSRFTYQVKAAAVIKQQLKDVGITVELMSMESTVFFHDLNAHDFDMSVVGWVGFVDPDEWTWALFHSDGAYNQQRYANPHVDELLAAGRRAFGHDQRRPIYQEIQRIIAREAPMVFLYVNAQTAAWRPSVAGFAVHPTGTSLGLRETWLAR